MIGLACLLIGIFPTRNQIVDPQTSSTTVEWTLGLYFSPIWAYTHHEAVDGTFEWQAGLRLIAWSWVPVLIGLVSIEWWSRRQVKEPD